MRMVNSLNLASNILKKIMNNQQAGMGSENGYDQPVNGKSRPSFLK